MLFSDGATVNTNCVKVSHVILTEFLAENVAENHCLVTNTFVSKRAILEIATPNVTKLVTKSEPIPVDILVEPLVMVIHHALLQIHAWKKLN